MSGPSKVIILHHEIKKVASEIRDIKEAINRNLKIIELWLKVDMIIRVCVIDEKFKVELISQRKIS